MGSNSITSLDIERQPGKHFCGMYRSDEEHRMLVVDYIRRGLEKGEKIVYLVSVQTAAQLRATFASAQIDLARPLATGQVIIFTAKDVYLKDGQFDPDKMLALFHAETERALGEGYPALRTTAEMMWALAGEPGSERLIEYESKLNTQLPHRCYALCQYDRRRFDAEVLLDVLHTHPKVFVDQHGFDNAQMYFIPPEGFLGSDRPGAMLDRWLQNLTRLHGHG